MTETDSSSPTAPASPGMRKENLRAFLVLAVGIALLAQYVLLPAVGVDAQTTEQPAAAPAPANGGDEDASEDLLDNTWFSIAFTGLSLGAIYAFIALGYTMVYGIIKLINFAHGEFFMMGAFAGVWVLKDWPLMGIGGFPTGPIIAWAVAFLVAAMVAGILALVVERTCYRPLRGHGTPNSSGVIAILFGLFVLLTPMPIGSGGFPTIFHTEDIADILGQVVIGSVFIIAGIGLVIRGQYLRINRIQVMRAKGDRIAALLTALGVSIFLQTFGVQLFTAEFKGFPPTKRIVDMTAFFEPGEGDAPLHAADDLFDNQTQSFTSTILYAGGDLVNSPNGNKWVLLPEGEVSQENYDRFVRLVELMRLERLLLRNPTQFQIDNAPEGMRPANNPVRLNEVKPGEELRSRVFVLITSNAELALFRRDEPVTREQVMAAQNLIDAKPFTRVETPPWLPRVGVLVLLAIAMIALFVVVNKTNVGKAMRAVSYDPQASSLMGIASGRVIATTFFIGAFLAGIAGLIYGFGWTQKIHPMLGFTPGLKAFIAAVIGGIGSIPGAVAGGFILGVVETVVQSLGRIALELGMSTQEVADLKTIEPYRDAVVYGLLILVLVVRPRGLFGKMEGEKV